jgi:PKD repeat protein
MLIQASLIIIVSVLLLSCPAHEVNEHSALWGREGEKWVPNGRLPNFSNAGYRRGDQPIPSPPVTKNVKQFGAKGDGVADDTAAFRHALHSGGVIFVPEGRYRITDQLQLGSNTVLRGADQDKTVLFLPYSFEDIRGALQTSHGGSKYSWGPHLIEGRGEYIGVEQLTVAFAETKYSGHLQEKGYNAIALVATHSWVRQVTIINADHGVYVMEGSRFVTVADVRLAVTGVRSSGIAGHAGIVLRGQDCLATRFTIEGKFVHDLGIGQASNRNVFSNGSAVDAALDHHGGVHYANLFSNIDVGRGRRVFRSGGNIRIKVHDYGTYWNLRKANSYPAIGASVPIQGKINVIGSSVDRREPNGKWFERLKPANIEPQELHDAQHARRQAGLLPNQKPTANAGLDRTVEADQAIVFTASASFDPDGDDLTFTWNFGDNSSGTGGTPWHTYTQEGTYEVTLTVRDTYGATDTDTVTLTVVPLSSPSGSGLVAHWTFDGGSGSTASDASGHGYHGTLKNMDLSKAWVAGYLGGALEFDGINDYVDIGSPEGLENLPSFTYAAWIFPKSWGHDNAGVILTKHAYIKHWRLVDSGSIHCYLDTKRGSPARSTAIDGTISLNTWQHVALTYDDNGDRQVHLYKNGKEVEYASQFAATGPLTSDARGNFLISGYDHATRWFDGRIDDVRLYNRALRVFELQRLVQGTLPVN